MSGLLDLFKTGFVIILLILALPIYSVIREADHNDDISFRYANSSVDSFVETATSQGFISPNDYRQLQQKLAATGFGYNITIEYYKKVLNPVYEGTNFQNRFTVDYEGYFTKDILNRMYPIGSPLSDDDPARRWNMHEGDLIVARVKQNTFNVSSSLKGILGFPKAPSIPIEYGGAVRHEAP